VARRPSQDVVPPGIEEPADGVLLGDLEQALEHHAGFVEGVLGHELEDPWHVVRAGVVARSAVGGQLVELLGPHLARGFRPPGAGTRTYPDRSSIGSPSQQQSHPTNHFGRSQGAKAT
jgi:hypothetical protein